MIKTFYNAYIENGYLILMFEKEDGTYKFIEIPEEEGILLKTHINDIL